MGLARNMLALAISATLCSTALAQSRPAAMPEDAQVTSPRWGGGAAAPSSLEGADVLLTQTVTAVPQARADAVVAKWTFRRLNSDLNRLSNFMLRDFRDSPEFDAAYAEFQDAYDAYEAARNNALAPLRGEEGYQAAVSIRNDVSEQIADEHDQKEPNREKLVSLAGLKLDTISSYRDRERDTLAADQNVVKARQRLINAGRELARIEKRFAKTVRDDEKLTELRRSREDARIAMLASAAYLEATRDARDIALRYAYVSRGYDRYVPRLTGYNYGYGYGHRYHGIPGSIYYPGTVIRTVR